MRDKNSTAALTSADEIGQDAGDVDTSPEPDAGGSNSCTRRERGNRNDGLERETIDPREDYLDTAGSGTAGTPSAMSSARLNTAGDTVDGLGYAEDGALPDHGSATDREIRVDAKIECESS